MVKNFDVGRYMGRWYEVAKIPFVWEVGCEYATADYSWNEEKQVIYVKNTCYDENKNIKRVSKGIARIPNRNDPSKLKVTFEENPNEGDYFLNFTVIRNMLLSAVLPNHTSGFSLAHPQFPQQSSKSALTICIPEYNS